jgi:hypothetical protein
VIAVDTSALGEQVVSKADLDRAVERLEHRIDREIGKLTGRLNFMQWQIGIIAALQVAALVTLFLH